MKNGGGYTNLTAAEVRKALLERGYQDEQVPRERTLRNTLNRMNYRLKRVEKGKPLKKTEQTDAIFANVQAVRDDPKTLEISIDTKIKVSMDEYVPGGKNQDRRKRESTQGMGS